MLARPVMGTIFLVTSITVVERTSTTMKSHLHSLLYSRVIWGNIVDMNRTVVLLHTEYASSPSPVPITAVRLVDNYNGVLSACSDTDTLVCNESLLDSIANYTQGGNTRYSERSISTTKFL